MQEPAEVRILGFIKKELRNRSKSPEVGIDTSILASGLLDSLFLIDLILFLEEEFPDRIDAIGKAKRADLDSVQKMIQYLGLK